MSRNTSRRSSDIDDERKGFEFRSLVEVGPKVLKSLSAETLSELVRVLVVLGGILIAAVVWESATWMTQRTAGWMTGVERVALGWSARVHQGRPTYDILAQSHVGMYTRETAVVFGLLGGLFGLLGGVGGGLITRSFPRAVKAGAVGFGFGLLACGAFCVLIIPIYLGLIIRTPDTRISIATHALIDSAAAAACGLATGLAARASGPESLRLVAAGVMGASLGALLFGLVETSWFPFESEFTPIPRSSVCRLIEYACATFVPAVCIAAILRAPSASKTDGENGTV